MYYTYMIRCVDNSIYTGITTDIERRFREHIEQRGVGAKYTRSHRPLEIVAVWSSKNRSLASALEYRIKHLSKKQKEELISRPDYLEKFLGDKVEIGEYSIVTDCGTNL